MKKIILSAAVAALCLTACKKEVKETETTVVKDTVDAAADTTASDVEKPRDSVAEMKAWEAYMTPGDAHKMMAEEAGTWNNKMTFWHDANSPAETAASTCEVKMILGGRYQEANYKGNMMGMPFEGRSTLAYDNATNEYTSTWIDNMGTGMMVMKGKMNADGKTIELHGEMVDPLEGKSMKCREVYTIVDAKTRRMEMFCSGKGAEYKMMEIVMNRK